MKNNKPLLDKECLLEKFSGKGGWTYAALPEISPDKNAPFGWLTVNGNIDGYELKKHKLLPMGNGRLFLPVKAEIRKKISKQAGDFVRITLYVDKSPLEIPEEIILCFQNEPKEVYEHFIRLTKGEQKSYLDWIYAAKKAETKANRIINMINRLLKKQKCAKKEIAQ